MTQLEQQIHDDLRLYLSSRGELDERMPDCPDVEEKWESLAKSYLPDGIREYARYPMASLGWMMYLGMAVAKMWDENWQAYAYQPDLYAYVRDKRGFDSMDEYVREEVLQLSGAAYDELEQMVGECAARLDNRLRRLPVEPGTKAAFEAYIASLHQLYLMGVAVQLHRMGYRMEQLN